MRNSEIIRTNVLALLRENDQWMTANELISLGNQELLMGMTKKTTFYPNAGTQYEGHSHPVFRVLSGMIRKDGHNVYTPEVKRRIRTTGPETGNYEYALTGVPAYFRRYRKAIKNA